MMFYGWPREGAVNTDGSPVELGRTYVRVDRTRYYVERVNVHAPGDAAREDQLVAARTGGAGTG